MGHNVKNIKTDLEIIRAFVQMEPLHAPVHLNFYKEHQVRQAHYDEW